MTFHVKAHKWWNADRSRLVDTGDEQAAFLAYPTGSEVPDTEARRVGLLEAEHLAEPRLEAPVTPEPPKRGRPPANKLGPTPANKSVSDDETL